MKSEFRAWSDIRVFLSVLREGSTLAASRKLGIAQPTVARRIDALEHETGLILFDRNTRGFSPTRAARELQAAAEQMERVARALTEQVAQLRQARPIRITAFSANFSTRAAKILSEFSMAHPNIRLEFIPTVRALDLKAGEADIALRIARKPPDPDLIRRKVSTAQYTLFGSQAYADKYGLPSSAQDLSGHKFVSFRRDGVPTDLHDWIAAHVVPEQIVAVFDDPNLMHAQIEAGHALGIVNLRLGLSDLKLIPCFDPPPEMNSEHLILISPEAHRRPEVRTFVKFFAPRYARLYE